MSFLKAVNIKKYIPVREGILSLFTKPKKWIRLVDDVTLEINAGEIHALIGEAASGKKALSRILIGLKKPSGGQVLYKNKDIFRMTRDEHRVMRRELQIIFGDPFSSLNPHFTVKEIIEEPLRLNEIEYNDSIIEEVLGEVDLTPPNEYLWRKPFQLSGIERQKTSLARALVLDPKFIVADEPVSLLDTPYKDSFLKLIKKINRDRGIAFLLITSHPQYAFQIADRISIMYLGKIIETSRRRDIMENPLHPYTQRLFRNYKEPYKITGEIGITDIHPSPDIPGGCRYHPDCPYAMDKCKVEEPRLMEAENGHRVACYLHE